MKNPTEDPISVAPVITGPKGRAWLCDIATRYRNLGITEADGRGDIANWIVEAPWAHPVWHSYQVVLLHLRPTTVDPSPMIHVPRATHEFWLQALDPQQPREPAILGTGPTYTLSPMNFAAQLVSAGDADAIARVEIAVRRICSGSLSPDTDFRRHWIALFGDGMLLAAERRRKAMLN
jgi:hypothetical protein